MALIFFSQQDDYDLVYDTQDIRGWLVKDENGEVIGQVNDMIVNTETEYVSAIVLENGGEIPASVLDLRDGEVIVHDQTAAVNAAGDEPAYQAVEGAAGLQDRFRVGKRTVNPVQDPQDS